jgi:redox-sensing transcriptional repressor
VTVKADMISMSVIRRLPRYYRFLYDLKQNGVTRISSHELAKRMGLTASQIRQDLNCFGEFGQQGYGYSVNQLYDALYHILGVSTPSSAILLGAGNLGRALVNHMSFENKGFKLVGVFDDSDALVGSKIHDITVQPNTLLEEFCKTHSPQLAILCIPKEAAPGLVERLRQCGVNAFWNFSHYDIALRYPDALVENVHLGDSLMTLSYRLNRNE